MDSKRFARIKAARTGLMFLLWTGCCPLSAAAGEPAPGPSLPDSLSSGERSLLLQRPVYETPGAMSPTLQLRYPPVRLSEPRRPVPLTPLHKIAFAADRGANAGLLVGTLGSVLGWWEEETVWTLMGAGAALGVIQDWIDEDP